MWDAQDIPKTSVDPKDQAEFVPKFLPVFFNYTTAFHVEMVNSTWVNLKETYITTKLPTSNLIEHSYPYRCSFMFTGCVYKTKATMDLSGQINSLILGVPLAVYLYTTCFKNEKHSLEPCPRCSLILSHLWLLYHLQVCNNSLEPSTLIIHPLDL